MERLARAEAWVIRAEKALLVGILSVMVCLSFAQVVLRHLQVGLLWADTLLRNLVLWVGFLGAALATVDGKHFALELSPEGHRGRGSRWRSLIAQAATALISAGLAAASFQFLAEERKSAEVLLTISSLNVPAWPFEAVIPAGFLLVLFHTVLRAAREAARRR